MQREDEPSRSEVMAPGDGTSNSGGGVDPGPVGAASPIGTLSTDLDLRRGLLFLIAIGVPLLVGLVRDEKGGALVGALTGMLLSLADTEGPLLPRVRMAVTVALGIAIG